MTHYGELTDLELEHLSAELLVLSEEGRCELPILSRISRVDDVEAALERLIGGGLAERDGDHLRLTARGTELAEHQVRRYRLAELLLSTVLQVEDDRVIDETACAIEHVLHPSVTDSVCAFLGHPKFCPHGRPIPPGRCCRTLSGAIQPLVQPLAQLAVGQTARVVYIVPKDPARLVKLSNLGLAPGTTVRLQQKRPATVLIIGETTLALDHDITAEIYVKPLESRG